MSDVNKKNEQQQDYLSSFIEQNTNNTESLTEQLESFDNQTSTTNNNIDNDNRHSGYIDIDMSTLPLKDFYKIGTKIKIKKAEVEDVQEYTSMIDDNYIDVTEKMNTLLSRCVRVIHPNGQIGNYRDVKDGDRYYLTFKIREITFPNDPFFKKEEVCSSCKKEYDAYFRSFSKNENEKRTIFHYEMDEKLKKYFNKDLRVFEINIKGTTYRLAPPVIGLSEIFIEDTKKKVKAKENPNVSFLKIIPFTLWDRSKISDDGIVAKEKEFKKMDMETFQILNKFIDKIKFGMKELKNVCPHCNEENSNDVTFKGGASKLFVMDYSEFGDLFED